MPVNMQLLITAVLGVAVSCTLWIAYFGGVAESLETALEGRSGVDRVTTARDVYSVMHFLLLAGLILVALAMKSALKAAEVGWHEPLAGYAAFALGLGRSSSLAGLWVMRLRAGARTSPGEPLVAAGALLLHPGRHRHSSGRGRRRDCRARPHLAVGSRTDGAGIVTRPRQ